MQNIASFASEMVIAQKYSTYQDIQFQKEHAYINKLEDVNNRMQREINEKELELTAKESDLRSLQNHLEKLNTAYCDALRREAEEAARAAQAAYI